ncbi:MAG TPA: NUDIX domain-containing protein [Steroidobacteraceae bacterium]|nr:NUDIX domain-containing protein [Steroidobacteraceae bacterium]
MKRSAGIVLYRHREGAWQVLLLHMGGPLWARKDAGAWTIPKGEYPAEEDPLTAARREFLEETGAAVDGTFQPLEPVRQRNGKQVSAWAVEGDFDPAQLRSNLFSMEWPPRSGRMQEFPEADRAAWYTLSDARQRMPAGQVALLDQLEAHLNGH